MLLLLVFFSCLFLFLGGAGEGDEGVAMMDFFSCLSVFNTKN